MIIGVGVDIENISEFKKNIKNTKFIKEIFTKKEIKYCIKKKEPWISFAGKFCSKEAVIKAFGKKIAIKEIEILNDLNNKPLIYIKRKKFDNINCSIAHTNKTAIAFVVLEK